jgi:uncharacterized cysteine cluster protein YcgN (CxxCxxCC family)
LSRDRISGEAPSSGKDPFWKDKRLDQMSPQEWESLCDGCGRCCLIKLEDSESGDVDYTDIACRLLDLGTCRCSDYKNRIRQVPDCVVLTPAKIDELHWMPSTCAYRLISEGKDLAWWHPLVSGDQKTVHQAGVSVRNRVVPEDRGDDPEDRIVSWPA